MRLGRQEAFKIDGLCWCPDERTLRQARLMGHTEDCTRAREAWRANMRGLEARREERERERCSDDGRYGVARHLVVEGVCYTCRGEEAARQARLEARGIF